MDPSCRICLEVDVKAVAHNFRQIQKKVHPAQIMGVLKANAYGLGVVPIAKALERSGADRFGIAEIREAMALAPAVSRPIQLLGELLPGEIPEAVRIGIVCPGADPRTLRRLSGEAKKQGRRVKIHYLIDTGMGRLGIPHAEAPRVIEATRSLPGIEVEGICSHFPVANEPRHPKNREQMRLFRELISRYPFPLRHIANSDGINNVPDCYFNMVRTGINLYGVFDLQGRRTYRLRPTLSLKTQLVANRLLEKGSTVGYGSTHKLSRRTRVGTIPIGYADGLPLAASGRGRVLIDGKPCRIIGRISMDYTTLELRGMNPIPGREVIVIGKSRGEEITVEDWARLKGTHPYDIICSLGPRVRRVHRL